LETHAVYFDAGTTSVDGTEIVHLNGELDLAAAPILDDVLSKVDRRRVVVDASGLTFVDVVGVKTLLQWREACMADGGDLVIRGATPALLRVLDLTGLAGSLRVDSG
jgi:anti-sigma B factor antagonist